MSWFARSLNELEAAKAHVLMFLAVDFDFPSGHARFWTGIGDLVIDGVTYTGTGEIGKISDAPDHTGLVAEQKSYEVSGVDPAVIPESDIEGSFGRSVVEYFGFLDPDTRALVELPEINWEGTINSVQRVRGSEPKVRVNAEHRMIILDQEDGYRYTHEHQQQFFSGDLGFDQVSAIALKKVLWGGKLVDPAVRDPTVRPGPPGPGFPGRGWR